MSTDYYLPSQLAKSLEDFPLNRSLTESINNVNRSLIGAMLKHSNAGHGSDNTCCSQEERWQRISLHDMRYVLLVCFCLWAGFVKVLWRIFVPCLQRKQTRDHPTRV